MVYTENVTKFSVIEITDFCHAHNIPLIISQVVGLAGRLFCDFGEKFTVVDQDGENVTD